MFEAAKWYCVRNMIKMYVFSFDPEPQLQKIFQRLQTENYDIKTCSLILSIFQRYKLETHNIL